MNLDCSWAQKFLYIPILEPIDILPHLLRLAASQAQRAPASLTPSHLVTSITEEKGHDRGEQKAPLKNQGIRSLPVSPGAWPARVDSCQC